jgi:hemerythrin
MSILQWNEKYSVGVGAMDDQHRILISILNELHEAMTLTHDAQAGERLLDKLLNYTSHHFNREEELMEASAFPGAAQHRLHHANMRQNVKDLMTRRGDPALNIDLMFFLRDWLKSHLLVEDKAYGPWLNQKGIQ